MLEVKRWGWPGLIPMLAGLVWISAVVEAGFWGWLIAGVFAIALLGTGVALFLFPGDNRITQFMAFNALLALVAFIPVMLVFGFFHGLLLELLMAGSGLVAGMVALQQLAPVEAVPEPEITLKNCGKTAIDEAIVGMFIIVPRLASVDDHERLLDELQQAEILMDEQGFIDDPVAFHEKPPVLTDADTRIRDKKILGHEVEWLSFESGYQPMPEMPGAERWLSFTNNQTAYAVVLRHDDEEDRPWLIGIHGYMMDVLTTVGLFSPKFYHEKLGFNVVLPILPLHGPRKRGKISGDGYIIGDAANTLNAVAQSQWDIRRLHSWIRQQSDAPIAVHGYSLGGLNTALLASLESDLAMAMPAIALADITKLMWHHMPAHSLRRMTELGIGKDQISKVFTPLAPLKHQCQLPAHRRFAFAGAGDSVIPPEYVNLLHEHWQVDNDLWYQGGHMTFRGNDQVKSYIKAAFSKAGLID